ncbi:MAG: DNA internalization-related competence protein ComEC/Rec2 [Gammaproteobacteria bacterium]|nr:DNA internalization-related competence protein ComEC/Rec2 [Gammaproteobacteria bacterium]
MRTGSLAFLAGIWVLQQCSSLPPVYLALFLIFTIPLALLVSYPQSFWSLAGWFFSGFFWALLYASLLLAKGLPPELESQNVMVNGYVAGLPESNGRRVRFLFDVESMTYMGQEYTSPGRIRLSWYYFGRSGRSGWQGRSVAPVIKSGDHWQLQVRLKRPNGFLNPAGFDYEGWLFQQGIRATGYVRNSTNNQKDTAITSSYLVHKLREKIANKIGRDLASFQSQGLLQALAIGDRSRISERQWDWLRDTGTSHLLAISGLHVGLVAGLFFLLARRCWCLSARLLTFYPAPKAAAVVSLLGAIVYAALAGFSIPTQRALIMLAVVMLAIVTDRHLSSSRVLALALLGVLIFDPLSVLSAGFWLSFGAVAFILYGLSGRLTGRVEKKGGWLRQSLRAQWWVTLGLAPLTLLFFQITSLVSLPANFVAIPLVSLLVVPLALIGSLLSFVSPELAQYPFELAASLLDGLSWFLYRLSTVSFASIRMVMPGGLSLILACTGIAWLLMPRGIPARWLGLLLICPLLLARFERPVQGEAFFTLLDVGQGLAVVVQTQNHVLVYDTGPRFSRQFDTGKAVLVPFLRQQGYQSIDKLLISHGDNDHIGGAFSLLRQFPASDIRSSVPQKLKAGGILQTVNPCVAGDYWQWDGVSFEILHPAKASNYDENDASCVLKIQMGNQSVLLTGDIEQNAEQQLVKMAADKLQSSILVAPHHGSNTSSTVAFISAVEPEYVLFPAGYLNRYRFPHNKVVERYAEAGVKMRTIAETGAMQIRLGSSDQPLSLEHYRKKSRRYWHTSRL